jgi:hypothetical protein
MKMFIRRLGLTIARAFGSQIVDHQSGQKLGRALLIVWRGKIHVVGLEAAVRPLFLPQKRLTYWKQELGFTAHPPPDFPTLGARQIDPATDDAH